MPVWTAEVEVDEELARRLIGAQFPQVELAALAPLGVGWDNTVWLVDERWVFRFPRREVAVPGFERELEPASLRLLGEGWDNTVWLVDERWVFRFPRREVAVPGFERELAALPELAPRLPLPIPHPVFHGRPSDEFPFPFFGAAQVPGREPLGLDAATRAGLARPLGHFLRALHDASVDGLPVDPMGRADMAVRVPRTVEQLAPVIDAGLWEIPDSVPRLLDAAHALPPTTATAVLHGDLHFRHLLVDGRGALSGVIDWGDICRGDPSIDLSLLWSLLPASARTDFLAAYGPIPEARLLRARVLAINLCSVLLLYGRHEGMADIEREALAGLDRAAAG